MSLIRPYSWLLEWLDTTQMVMVVRRQQILNIIIIPQHILLLQLCPKIIFWGCPWSGSEPGCWSGWTPPRWAWLSGNIFQSLILLSPTSLVIGTWLKIQSPRAKMAILVQIIVQPITMERTHVLIARVRRAGMPRPDKIPWSAPLPSRSNWP